MKKEEISELIEDKFYSTSNLLITRITYKNGRIYNGVFRHFEDFNNLKAQHKHRFIPNNSVLAFHSELENTKIPNPNHSVILDCDQIEKVEILEPSL